MVEGGLELVEITLGSCWSNLLPAKRDNGGSGAGDLRCLFLPSSSTSSSSAPLFFTFICLLSSSSSTSDQYLAPPSSKPSPGVANLKSRGVGGVFSCNLFPHFNSIGLFSTYVWLLECPSFTLLFVLFTIFFCQTRASLGFNMLERWVTPSNIATFLLS